MKAFVVPVLILLTAASVAIGQSTPPPPAKAVPAPGSYESKEGGFKIAFPARPTLTSTEIDSSYGKTSVNVHILPTSLAEYTVVHTDFPTAIKDKFDLDSRFDNMRDSQVKRLNGRLMEENEYYFGSNYGRSLVIETAVSTMTVRAVIVEQRLFVLSVLTRGKLSTQSATLRNANTARINKFLDSFEVTSIPKPLLVEASLPADFGVTVKDTVFASGFFDLSVRLPAGWTVLSSEDSDFLLELGKEGISRSRPKLAEWMTPENTRILLSASKTPLETGVNSAILIIAAEKVSYPNFLPMSVAQTYAKMFLDPGEKVVRQPTLQMIGGVEFAWLETYDQNDKLFQRMYFSNRKGIAFEFSLTYRDSADLGIMLQSLNSLKLGTAPIR